jgi:uncharacterized membrane protein YjgN (DUF898 family)
MVHTRSGNETSGSGAARERGHGPNDGGDTAAAPENAVQASPTPPTAAGGPGEPPTPPGAGGPRGPSGPDRPGTTAPRENLRHDGRFGEIFVLFLINLLLTIVTLGIYRFWGKTRIRKYVWSHTSLRGERLEYAGAGLELFLGFLFALIIFGGPILGVYLWLFANPPDQITLVIILLALYPILFLFFFFIYYVAIFAAYRYRISRTAWFGIRGGMEGSAWTYGFLGLGLGILNGLTIGWTKPWADSVVFQYRLSRTWFGSEKFRSTVDSRGLYGPFALAWIGSVIVAIIAFGVIGALLIPDMVEQTRHGRPIDQTSLQIATVVVYLVPILAYQLLVPWYKAALVRNIANTLSVGDIRFQTQIRGGQMFALLIPNLLLLIFTLGLGFPYVILRTARYVARHLVITGDVEMARVRQTEVSAPWYGEGILEFLGVGMI